MLFSASLEIRHWCLLTKAVSLGKTNNCLQALIDKGYVKLLKSRKKNVYNCPGIVWVSQGWYVLNPQTAENQIQKNKDVEKKLKKYLTNEVIKSN